MSDSEAHNGTAEVSDNTENQQQPSPPEPEQPVQPVEQKPEDKASVAQPEEAKQAPETKADGKTGELCTENNKDVEPEKDYLNQVAEEMVNEVFDEVVQTEITVTERESNQNEQAAGDKSDSKNKPEPDGQETKAKEVCVITSKSDWPSEPVESSTAATVETPEVSSTRNDDIPSRKPVRSSRRASYVSNRSYAGGSYQNYGLTYLPYKSNFEPSEEARRRADEFFKTFKL